MRPMRASSRIDEDDPGPRRQPAARGLGLRGRRRRSGRRERHRRRTRRRRHRLRLRLGPRLGARLGLGLGLRLGLRLGLGRQRGQRDRCRDGRGQVRRQGDAARARARSERQHESHSRCRSAEPSHRSLHTPWAPAGAVKAPRIPAVSGRASGDLRRGVDRLSAWMSRSGGRVRLLRESCRGTSGLHRARWWPTATRSDPRDSATENRPPRHRLRPGAG